MVWSSLRWHQHSVACGSALVKRRSRGSGCSNSFTPLNRGFRADRSRTTKAAAIAVVGGNSCSHPNYWLCSSSSIRRAAETREGSWLTNARLGCRSLTTSDRPESNKKHSSSSSKSNNDKAPQPPPPAASIKPDDSDDNPPPAADTTTKTSTYTIKSHSELMKQWLHELQSIPNIITLSRIACTPLISYWIVTGQAEYAFCGGFIAGLSDMLDGYLAKRYNMTTVMGTFLDPLADKLLVNVVSLSLYSIDMLPGPLVFLWLARDVGLVYATHRHVLQQSQNNLRIMYDLSRTPLQVHPTTISKINTALQFFTLGTALAHPMIVTWLPVDVLPALCWVTGTTTIASGLSYMSFPAFSASGNQPTSSK